MSSSSYTPPFIITNTIVEHITSISELIGKLSVKGAPYKNPQLRRNNRIQTIHSSLALENNTLTLAQVTDIIDGKLVLGTLPKRLGRSATPMKPTSCCYPSIHTGQKICLGRTKLC